MAGGGDSKLSYPGESTLGPPSPGPLAWRQDLPHEYKCLYEGMVFTDGHLE